MSQSRQATATVNVPVTTNAETVVATLAGVQQNFDQAQILVEGWAQVTTGTATTAVTARIRRGVDATGTLVGEGNPVTIYAAVGSTEERSVNVIDTPPAGGPYTYVLTLQQTAGTADGSALQSSLAATIEGPSGA